MANDILKGEVHEYRHISTMDHESIMVDEVLAPKESTFS